MKDKVINQLKQDYKQYITSVGKRQLDIKLPHNGFTITINIPDYPKEITVEIIGYEMGSVYTKHTNNFDEIIKETRKALHYLLGYHLGEQK